MMSESDCAEDGCVPNTNFVGSNKGAVTVCPREYSGTECEEMSVSGDLELDPHTVDYAGMPRSAENGSMSVGVFEPSVVRENVPAMCGKTADGRVVMVESSAMVCLQCGAVVSGHAPLRENSARQRLTLRTRLGICVSPVHLIWAPAARWPCVLL